MSAIKSDDQRSFQDLGEIYPDLLLREPIGHRSEHPGVASREEVPRGKAGTFSILRKR